MLQPESEQQLQESPAPHEEVDPAIIRWMPVAVPLGAAMVLGLAFIVWSTVL